MAIWTGKPGTKLEKHCTSIKVQTNLKKKKKKHQRVKIVSKKQFPFNFHASIHFLFQFDCFYNQYNYKITYILTHIVSEPPNQMCLQSAARFSIHYVMLAILKILPLNNFDHYRLLFRYYL